MPDVNFYNHSDITGLEDEELISEWCKIVHMHVIYDPKNDENGRGEIVQENILKYFHVLLDELFDREILPVFSMEKVYS